MIDGVSVIICCHNSEGRLKPTLSHLAAQRCPKAIAWEVLVVDNASNDHTADTAKGLWDSDSDISLRIVAQPKLGLVNARQKGIEEAKYQYVSFIDDDNWVTPNWVETVYRIMQEHPEAGACGGKTEAVCDIAPPTWFDKYKGKYAVGDQADTSGDVTWNRGYLWGAGLTMRKIAWEFIVSNGFQPLLTGRFGGHLSAGDDNEICLALRLAGWKLWYDEQLTLQHYLPAGRLHWDYLKKLVRGFGASSVLLSPYHLALIQDINAHKGRTGKIWLWKLRSVLVQLVRLQKLKIGRHFSEGDEEILDRERLLGSVQELLRIRGMLDSYVYEVYNARWNTIRNQVGSYGISHPA